MSSDESAGAHHDIPVATAIPKRDGTARAASGAGSGIVLDPRVLFVGGAVALIGVTVLGLFLWMVPTAAARELKAACGGLHKADDVINPALCAAGTSCTTPLPAPDFTAQDVTGKMVKLSDFRGKVVLLNFWASWCGVCKEEKPKLDAMASEM